MKTEYLVTHIPLRIDTLDALVEKRPRSIFSPLNSDFKEPDL